MFQLKELVVWHFLLPEKKMQKSVATNINEVEQHIVSPNMNIYCLMIQKHTSQIGLTNDFSALLLLPNSPPQKQSPLVESESKQTL